MTRQGSQRRIFLPERLTERELQVNCVQKILGGGNGYKRHTLHRIQLMILLECSKAKSNREQWEKKWERKWVRIIYHAEKRITTSYDQYLCVYLDSLLKNSRSQSLLFLSSSLSLWNIFSLHFSFRFDENLLHFSMMMKMSGMSWRFTVGGLFPFSFLLLSLSFYFHFLPHSTFLPFSPPSFLFHQLPQNYFSQRKDLPSLLDENFSSFWFGRLIPLYTLILLPPNCYTISSIFVFLVFHSFSMEDFHPYLFIFLPFSALDTLEGNDQNFSTSSAVSISKLLC